MIRDFSKEEIEQGEDKRDTEFTLGGGSLLAVATVLIVLCAVCFGLGYSFGRRNLSESPSSNSSRASTKPPLLTTGSGAKPAASARSSSKAPDYVAEDPEIAADPAQTSRAEAVKRQDVSHLQASATASAQLASTGEAATGASTSPHKILPPSTNQPGWIVQIAAVSHPEDAEVLVSALSRRGYAVTARRDNADTLIHVQTGPFVNRNDANAMRQKLLNDGYNAVVQ